MNERLLRKMIRMSLLHEKIVNFDGEEFNVPDAEVEKIKSMLRTGQSSEENWSDAMMAYADDEDWESEDRAYDADKTIEEIMEKVPEDKREKLKAVLNVYGDTLQDTLVKTIHNSGDEIINGLFSIDPSFGDHSFPSAVWNDLMNIHNPGRSKAIGRGEAALALVLTGVSPDSGSGAHDLEIAGLGGVHVKDTGASGGLNKPDVPMGKGLGGDDMSRPFYQSVKNASKIAGFKLGRGLGTTLLQTHAKTILEEFAKLQGAEAPYDYVSLADAWEEDILDAFRNSESWGESGAIIFVDKGGLGFSIVPPEDSYPTRIENNKWRVGKASAYPGGRFAEAFKKNLPVNESISILGALGMKRNEKMLSVKNNEKVIREFVRDLIVEKLSKSDKKEIEKISRKQADTAIKTALGASFFGTKGKINKFVIDSINKEVGRILKDKATKQEIADVCKTVMVKLYRELAITYRPIIDRIKV